MFTNIRRYLREGDLHNALQKQAEAIGEREKHRALHEFYATKRQLINPEQDHWGYAEHREKELEHAASVETKDDEVTRWTSRINVIQAKLRPLPVVPSKRPWLLFLRRRAAVA